MSDTVFGIGVDDKLTPELQKAKAEMQELSKEAVLLKNKMQALKDNKNVFIDATKIHESSAAVQKLQMELRELEKAEAKATVITKKKREIQALLNQEMSEYGRKLDATKALQSEASNSFKKLETATNKATVATKKEKTAINATTVSRKKDNAVRDSAINGVVRHLRQLETLVVAYYSIKTAMDYVVTAGIQLNKTVEDGQVGIAALISANSEGGTDIDRFNASMAMSSAIMKDIKLAAVDTAATFPQLTEVYQQAIGSALGSGKAMGDSLDEISQRTIKISQQMTNAAASIGMPMVQVNEEIRSIMEGTIDVNSRIAKMLHITNKEIKASKETADGLFNYIQEKLKPFDAMVGEITMTKVVARFADAMDTIRLDATKPIFDDMKNEIADVTTYIKENTAEWTEQYQDIYFSVKQNFTSMATLTKPITDSLLAIIDTFQYLKSSSMGYGDAFSESLAVLGGSLSIVGDSIKNISTLLKISANGIEMLFAPIASFLEKVIARIATAMNGYKMMYDVFDTGGDNIAALDAENIRLEKIINAPLAMNKAKIAALDATNKVLASQVITLSQMADNADKAISKTFQAYSNPVDYRALSTFDSFEVTKSTTVLDLEAIVGGVDSYYEILKIKAEGNADYLIKLEKKKNQTLKNVAEQYAANQIELSLKTAGENQKAIDEKQKAIEKAEKELEKMSKKIFKDWVKLGRDWEKEKDKLTVETATLQMGMYEKTNTKLAAQYEVDLAKYSQIVGSKEIITENYKAKLESVNEATIAMSSVFSNAFKSMEDAIVDFVQTGKLDFTSLIDSILEDIMRLQIQQAITKPLMNSLTAGGTTSVASSLGSFFFANGGIMTSQGAMPLKTYSTGGIANSAQVAIYGEGSMNEAYVPLPDGKTIPVTMSGGGASNVVVNIENNSGTEVTQDNVQTSFDGETIIVGVVLDAINRNKGGMRDSIKAVR